MMAAFVAHVYQPGIENTDLLLSSKRPADTLLFANAGSDLIEGIYPADDE